MISGKCNKQNLFMVLEKNLQESTSTRTQFTTFT